jgi:hypothetical protein
VSALPPLARFFVAPGTLAVAIFAFFYCLLERSTSSGSAAPATAWGAAAAVVASPQFLSFVIVPSWLLYCILDSRSVRSTAFLLRCGTHTRALNRSLIRGIATFGGSVLTVVIVLLIAAAGLPVVGAPLEFESPHGAVSVAAALGVILQLGVLLITLTALRAVIIAVGLTSNRIAVSLVLAIACWMWILASSNGLLSGSSLADASHFFSVAAFIASPLQGACALGIGVAVILLAHAWTYLADGRTRAPGPRIISSWVPFFSVAAIAVFASVWAASSPGHPVSDNLEQAFPGSLGTVTQGLASDLLWVGFAFVMYLRSSEAFGDWKLQQLLRFGSDRRLLRGHLTKAFIAAVLYSAAVSVAAGTCSIVVAGSPAGLGSKEFVPVVYQFLLNGTLQIWLCFVVITVVVEVSRSKASAVLTSAVLAVLSSVRVDPQSWYPFGAESLMRAQLGWPAVLIASASAIAAAAGALFVLFIVRVLAKTKFRERTQ